MLKRVWQAIPSGIVCLCVIFALFGYIGSIMGVPNMLNTIMKTAHDLLLNTVFYLMGICVITGAIGRLFVEFGVVSLLEKLLRPLMRPLFNLPGVSSPAAFAAEAAGSMLFPSIFVSDGIRLKSVTASPVKLP